MPKSGKYRHIPVNRVWLSFFGRARWRARVTIRPASSALGIRLGRNLCGNHDVIRTMVPKPVLPVPASRAVKQACAFRCVELDQTIACR